MMAKTAFFVGTLASILSAESLVLAQARPAAAPAPAPAPAPVAAPAPPPPAPAPAPEPVAAPPVAAAPAPAAPADEGPDHDRFVGHLGITYFDIANLPISGGLNAAPATVTAPIIGARIWLSRNLGIDAGIGFGVQGGSVTTDNGVQSTTTNLANPWGLGLHAGLPIGLAHYKHYSFLVIPQATLGFTSASQQQMGFPDLNRNGTLIEVGARAGAEIHFGFIGIPELALQATIGAFFDAEFTKASQGQGSFSTSATSLSTTVGGAPWAIFTNNISATYYL